MATKGNLGAKVKAVRRREQLTQVQLAERLGISASYLNLIEHNRRPLTAPLLIKLAHLFKLDLDAFAGEDESRLGADLMEAFGDPLFDGHDLRPEDVRELVGNPAMARSVLSLYQSYRTGRESMNDLASRLTESEDPDSPGDSRLPTEEVSDLIQRHMNYFPELEAAAEALWQDASLDSAHLFGGLERYLEEQHGVVVKVVKMRAMGRAVRRYDPVKKLLYLNEVMPPRSRKFQVAHQVGLLSCSELLDRISRDQLLSGDESRALCRVALANYYAGAVMMPYGQLLEAARNTRYDIELLGHRFRTGFEQVCHRLTTLRRPGSEGIPLHFVRVDMAGNISKRFSGSGVRFARFSGACPRWNVYAAFLTPGTIHVQLCQMADGATFFTVACTIRRASSGYHATQLVQAVEVGCEVGYAREMVYSDGIDLENLDAAVPVGVTCRLCERLDCEVRAFPPLQHPLHIDENVRGISFYAPLGDG